MDEAPIVDDITHGALVTVEQPHVSALSVPMPQHTVASLIAEVIARGRSPQTKRAYAGDLDDFLCWWLAQVGVPYRSHSVRADVLEMVANTTVAAHLDSTLRALQMVTEGHIQQYLHHLEGDRSPNDDPLHAPATINRRLTPLRLLFSRLHRHRLIGFNPMEDVRGRKTSNASTTMYLSRAQARELVTACGGDRVGDLRDRAIVLLMLTSGLRASEVVSIDIDDLQTVEGHFVVWVKGKGGARERVKVQRHAWEAIGLYHQVAGLVNGPLFRRVHAIGKRKDLPAGERQSQRIGETRLTYIGLYALLQERFLAAGFVDASKEPDIIANTTSKQKRVYGAKVSAPRLALHSLRHTHITLAIRGGAPLPVVQKGARHQNVQTTMRYARDMDSLDDAAGDYVKL